MNLQERQARAADYAAFRCSVPPIDEILLRSIKPPHDLEEAVLELWLYKLRTVERD